MFHKTLDEACAGDQMGILTKGVKKDEVRRGMAVIKPGTVKQHDVFQAQLYLLTKEEGGGGLPLTNNKSMSCFSKTWDCTTFMSLHGGKEMVMPGEDSQITMKLLKPMVLEEGQQFTIRLGKVTMGTGKVTKCLPNMTTAEKEYLLMPKKKKEKLDAANAAAAGAGESK